MARLTRKRIVVIDVGAAIGDTALFFKKFGAKAIYGYELDETRVRFVKKNIKLNEMSHSVVAYNKMAKVEDLHKLMATINDPIFLKLDCDNCEYDYHYLNWICPRLQTWSGTSHQI
jgi:ribosomal protein L11 methylase PrmA